MDKIQVFHNKSCSKSCSALSFLKEHGVDEDEMEVSLYMDNRIDRKTARKIVDLFVGNLEDLIRLPDAKKLGIEIPEELTKGWVVEHIIKQPKIMQRPIIIKDGKAVIARSPESLDTLI